MPWDWFCPNCGTDIDGGMADGEEMEREMEAAKGTRRRCLSCGVLVDHDTDEIIPDHFLEVSMGSETDKCRNRIAKYCEGMGLDLGFGGDVVVPWAITLDLPKPYTKVGNSPQNLRGDARDLYWFRDGVFDFVFSSHLFEDFSPEEMPFVLIEWLRVIKPGGFLILFLPDEQRYRASCESKQRPRNESHKVENFSLHWFLENIFPKTIRLYTLEVVESYNVYNDYCFGIVIKVGGTNKDEATKHTSLGDNSCCH